MSQRTPAPLPADGFATVALIGYSIAVAIGFGRVFSGWDFLPDLVAIALVVHGLSFVMRRLRLNGWLTIPVVTAIAAWLITALHYRRTLSRWLPGSATWDQITTELDLVRDQFPTAVAPVLYGSPWAPLASFALALVVVMSDSFAFRAEARGEALVPGGVLFVFVAALGDGRLQVISSMLLVGSGVATVVALRRLHDRTRNTVLTARRWSVPIALPTVAGAACIAVLAGVIGPRLPGAEAEPWYDAKGGGGTNLVDHPFVDIRSRLTNLGNQELFRVNADQAEYWRLITLAAFDGEQFTLPERPLADIGEVRASPDEGRRIRQQIQILGLSGELVPAAADPVQASLTRASGERLGLRQQPDSSTLIAPAELERGDVFDIVSVAPSVTSEQLRASGVADVPDPVYLELPDDLPDVVRERTLALTAGAASPFDAALAIQAWFRDPDEFTYSLEVQSGHGSTAIEAFFHNRAGYCEQFAASFAAMARVVGIPSRVAVGYTPGVPDPDEPGWNSVIGKNAHAWPELWFDDVGWVMFEPTPGRGNANTEAYTGVPAAQDESGPTGTGNGDAADETGTAAQPTTPPTLADQPAGPATPTTVGQFPDGAGNLAGPDFQLPDFGEDLAGGGGAPPQPDQGFTLVSAQIIAIVLIAFALTAPWLTRRLVRARRRATGGQQLVRAAWSRALDAATDAGVTGSPSMTATEWSVATARVLPVAARPMASLARVVDQVMFAAPETIDVDRPGSLGTRLADDCEQWADQIEMVATDTFGRVRRIRRYFVRYG